MNRRPDAALPGARAARLIVGGPVSGKEPRPPLGLSEWTQGESEVVVLLVAAREPARSLDEEVALVAAQLPDARSLPPATTLIVLPETGTSAGLFRRLLSSRPPLSRASRCSALLARGYTGIACALDPRGSRDLARGVAG